MILKVPSDASGEEVALFVKAIMGVRFEAVVIKDSEDNKLIVFESEITGLIKTLEEMRDNILPAMKQATI